MARSRAKTMEEKRDECLRMGKIEGIPEMDVFETEGRERLDQAHKFRTIAIKFNTQIREKLLLEQYETLPEDV